MPSANYGVSLSGAGSSINQSLARTADGAESREVTLPVAQAGQLTTRTDANTGTITMSSGGHTITTGMHVDIYWAGGVQYDVTVGSVSGTAVPIDLGVGDNLPTNMTNVTVSPQTSINLTVDGDNLSIIGVCVTYSDPASTAKAHVDFQDSGPASVVAKKFSANTPFICDVAGGAANDFTGNVIQTLLASQGDAVNTAKLTVILLVNA